MQTSPFKTPVAMFVFRRPETTRRVFEVIANIRPARLLLIADGPRAGMPSEEEACHQVREIVSHVDWPCEVSTNFADHNLGCQRRMISGLNWVFSLVEEAILLEDDCLPDVSFFRYCEEILTRYRDNPVIFMAAGFNPIHTHVHTNYSYYFSNFCHCWGWATWRRAWAQFDERITSWPDIRDAGLLQELLDRRKNLAYWTDIFDQTYHGPGLNAWDYQWFYAMITHHSLCVVPQVNLVENIGFGSGATHTVYDWEKPIVKVGSIQFPLIHPPALIPLRSMDRIDQQLSGFQTQSLAMNIRGKIRRALSRALRLVKARRNDTR
jgi:hypothetical protein